MGGTLRFDGVKVGGFLSGRWPRFIPQTDGTAIPALDQGLEWPAYAVGLRRVFSPSSRTLLPRFADQDVHQVLGLADGRRAVLVGYAEDPLVEAFWSYRRRDRLVERIVEQGWDLILAPNFSIYGNWPRVEHLINMRRSVIIAAEGAVVAPNLYWYRLEDLRRWADWVGEADLPAVAINLQTVRENTNWHSWSLPGLSWLAENLPERLPVFVTGLSRTERISAVNDLFGSRLHVVSQNPYQYALHGAVMMAGGRQDVHAEKADAFAATVRYMASLLEER
ncbi:hypothetical protein [Actinocorallia longicatena]|uniref:DUF4417 domain-containing protein n=1 Tax=Actinocorallia longicatena TaxID=111803 RepID=A0ABP6QR01_9ACTN